VTGYEPGKGNKGVTGALKCEMASGKVSLSFVPVARFAQGCSQKFKVGTGLSHAQRTKPPKVGAIIVYRFQELTRDGVPRYARV
jgi:DNA ligase-1